MFEGLLLAWVVGSPGAQATLKEAATALADFRAEDALVLLEKAKAQGPHEHADYVLLYEDLGITYAYLENTDHALSAFRMMLSLDPSRAISYTLSPKVTFVFEEARKRALENQPPGVDLSWPRDLQVDLPVPVDVEVLADPENFLKRARIYYRLKGTSSWQEQALELPSEGAPPVRVELPPLAIGARDNQTLELFLIARDAADNEVLLFGSSRRPREIALAYAPPDPWYGKWWIWAIAGTVVAVGAGTAVFAATREPGAEIDGDFRALR